MPGRAAETSEAGCRLRQSATTHHGNRAHPGASPRSGADSRARLREIDYGHWEGLRRSEVESRFPAEYAIWQEDPFVIAPLGGESGVNVLNRALPAMRGIVERHRHGTVLLVSHKGTNRLLISSLLGFDLRGYRDRLEQSPAALNILDFMSEVRARLSLFNDVSHYADE
jgi:broad specificity phosphatase PhoE